MYKIIFTSFLLILFSSACNAAAKNIEAIYPKVCNDGVHKQPNGEFAIYTFCDDAHGTNIAIMHLFPGDSELRKWPITKRFWQNEPWSRDVDYIGWVPNKNFLVVATSEIYGEGSIYFLDLENQVSKILLKPVNCGISILAITETSVTVGLNNCNSEKPYKKQVLKFPKFKL